MLLTSFNVCTRRLSKKIVEIGDQNGQNLHQHLKLVIITLRLQHALPKSVWPIFLKNMLNETLITSAEILHKTLWVCFRFGLVDRCPLSRPISKPWWCLNRSFLHEVDRSWSKSLHSKFCRLSILLINTHRNWLFSFSSSICTSDRPSIKLGSGTFFQRFKVELDCWSGCVFVFCSFRFRPLLEIFVPASVDFSVCFEFLLFRRFGRNDFGTFASVNFIILSIWVFAIDEPCFSVEISFFLTQNSASWLYQLHGPMHQW